MKRVQIEAIDLKTNQMLVLENGYIGTVINNNIWYTDRFYEDNGIEVLYKDEDNDLRTITFFKDTLVTILVEEPKQEEEVKEIKPVKMTVAKLVKMAQAEMVKEGYTLTDLDNNCLCELCQETNKAIIEASEELVSITSKEWSWMNRNNNVYGEYDTIEEAKHSILHDVVSYILEGNKTTVLQLKKKILANIIGE